MTTYLTEAELIAINRKFSTGAILNQGNLDAAINNPQAGFGGQPLLPTLAEKAACLVERISQGHPFLNGNKRTASAALDTFIKKNRDGKGVLASSQYVVGRCADTTPIAGQELTTAISKLIPTATANQTV